MNLNLIISNTKIDLQQDASVTLQKNSNICGAIDKINTSRSFTIVCPFTDSNKAFFQHMEIPSNTSDFLTTAKEAVFYDEGICCFSGKANLLSIGTDGFEICLVFGDLTALATLIADSTKISELGIADAWSDWNPSILHDTEKNSYGMYRYAIRYRDWETDRKSTRLNSSHSAKSRMPSSA